MRENELTPEEQWRYMPKRYKALFYIVVFGMEVLFAIQF
jgi:hypothetical protein